MGLVKNGRVLAQLRRIKVSAALFNAIFGRTFDRKKSIGEIT
jgi:hypothetical protein